MKSWLDKSLRKITPSHTSHAELSDLRRRYPILQAKERAREQVAEFYKEWLDIIEALPITGRSMGLFQDLSAAYALGKSLPELTDEGTSRRPEAVAEPLMLSCL